MEQILQFVIPALMGVESTVAYELKKLGLSGRKTAGCCARAGPPIFPG